MDLPPFSVPPLPEETGPDRIARLAAGRVLMAADVARMLVPALAAVALKDAARPVEEARWNVHAFDGDLPHMGEMIGRDAVHLAEGIVAGHEEAVRALCEERGVDPKAVGL